ncbi:unnamed protein product, partial [Allacma fusca]
MQILTVFLTVAVASVICGPLGLLGETETVSVSNITESRNRVQRFASSATY